MFSDFSMNSADGRTTHLRELAITGSSGTYVYLGNGVSKSVWPAKRVSLGNVVLPTPGTVDWTGLEFLSVTSDVYLPAMGGIPSLQIQGITCDATNRASFGAQGVTLNSMSSASGDNVTFLFASGYSTSTLEFAGTIPTTGSYTFDFSSSTSTVPLARASGAGDLSSLTSAVTVSANTIIVPISTTSITLRFNVKCRYLQITRSAAVTAVQTVTFEGSINSRTTSGTSITIPSSTKLVIRRLVGTGTISLLACVGSGCPVHEIKNADLSGGSLPEGVSITENLRLTGVVNLPTTALKVSGNLTFDIERGKETRLGLTGGAVPDPPGTLYARYHVGNETGTQILWRNRNYVYGDFNFSGPQWSPLVCAIDFSTCSKWQEKLSAQGHVEIVREWDDGTRSRLEFACGQYYNLQSGRNSTAKNGYSGLVKPTCVLYHEVIEGGNALSSHVPAPKEEDSGLSAGAIAGIVIAVVAVIGASIAGVIIAKKKGLACFGNSAAVTPA
jgi:hypothetical protein